MSFLGPSALYQLLRSHSVSFGPRFFLFVTASAAANALLLATINAAAENAAIKASNFRLLVIFLALVGLFILAQWTILTTSAREVERILAEIRRRIAERIARADLMTIERLGRSEIYASLHRETVTISQAAQFIAIAIQSSLMVAFSFLYLMSISRPAFYLTIVMTVVSCSLYFRRATEMNRFMHEAAVKENEFFDALTHLLDGFKEVRLHAPRGRELFARLERISGELRDVKTRTGSAYAQQLIVGQLAIYILLGAVVFVLPQYTPLYTTVVLKATASILFIIGPMSTILVSIPTYANANVAAQNIATLEATLDLRAGTATEPHLPPEPVEVLRFQDVTFEYQDRHAESFKVGPINVTINGGDTVFIVGGNGSGKSTFLKVIAGLYPSQAGTIVLNRTVLTGETGAWYRSHFSAVFSDYHLFDRLYGLEAVTAQRVDETIAGLELGSKTAFADGRFTTLDLSLGQRKRLALAVALLEDRPVLLFDEWAAEQDAPFRRRFYEELVPKWKAAGRTIIAVTHDDRYYTLANRLLRMDYGELREIAPPRSQDVQV